MKKKHASQSGMFGLHAIFAVLFCAAAVGSMFVTETVPAFFRPAAQPAASQRALTFAERVAYQRAIEEVYWRHRIWPKQNSKAKPPLDAVMSQAQLEKKVADYLRESQALEDYWQRPITSEQLQAEMDLMAKNTKQPEVLGELFAALGNDPFVIAECLARPALADRLLRNWYARDQRIHGELRKRAEADLSAHPAVEQMKQTSGTYREIELVRSDSPAEEATRGNGHRVKLNRFEWEQTVQKLAATFSNRGAAPQIYEAIPKGVLSPLQEDETRYYATTIISKSDDRLKLGTIAWHKEPLESWLARAEKQPDMTVAAGASYSLPKISDTADSCIGDTWTALPGPPDGRVAHTAVWTGSEMIIWGGNEYLNTGGRYNPATDSWTTTSNTNAPTPRDYHTAVWTGSEMIVWGGYDATNGVNTGGRYNPTTDSWVTTTTTNAPEGRGSHTGVWTGSQMIVWGGNSNSGYLTTGGRYNPNTDSWTVTSTTNAPEGRIEGGAVWTGSEMIVWGGYFYDGNQHYLNTGGRYNPDTDSWTPTSITNAPIGRDEHTAVWTGSEMIVWGGERAFLDFLNTGGRYNPSTDSWVATSTTNAPEARDFHTAVWTGSNEMIVWGGEVNEPGGLTNSGGRYNPSNDSWTVTSTINAPIPRYGHRAVWTGSEMLVWGGGINGQSPFLSDDGGRYDPATDSWAPISSGNTPAARFRHTAVWTGTEMIVWGGQVGYSSYLNTGGSYIPSIDNWSATSTTDAPSARDLHTAIWTGTEMIVWGGNEFGYPMNTGARDNTESAPSTPTPSPTPPIPATGGRYDPATDTWTATNTINAPSVRWRHTAVWTGSEMIVWGGSWTDMVGPHYHNSGGQYDPMTDSWSETGGSGVPDPRDSHSAVWTGTEMIVWGGWNGVNSFNSGGRYNPGTGIWTSTSMTNVPTARRSNTAVWTGNEMIIWGGSDGTSYLNTGGRYNPSMDAWTATNTADAPTGRLGHTAVWNDSDMIIWGGQASTDPPAITFNTGGRYNPSTDSWTATSLTGVPAARSLHTAIWTGNEMIVWGGRLVSSQNTHTGARYCAQSGAPSPTPTPTATPTPRPTPVPRLRPTAAPRP
jgi:N-acetylneuraminic acid mutarotase